MHASHFSGTAGYPSQASSSPTTHSGHQARDALTESLRRALFAPQTRAANDRDTYHLQEAIDAKAKWLQLPDRKETIQRMQDPETRLPGREGQRMTATEKALQNANQGLQTLMKYQKHSKSTFRPAVFTPVPGQNLAPGDLPRAKFIMDNRQIQDMATQHVNTGSGSTHYRRKVMPKQGAHPSWYTEALEAIQVTQKARALAQVTYVSQATPDAQPLRSLVQP